MKKITILLSLMILSSCLKNELENFENILTNEKNVWGFYTGNYSGYKNSEFTSTYKFSKDNKYHDLYISPQLGGSGTWEIISDKKILRLNKKDDYKIISYNNDSIVLESITYNSEARFYNIKVLNKLKANFIK